MNDDSQKQYKSIHAEREEKILKDWQEKQIFEKTLQKNQGQKPYVFYEGPPTANGRPGIHHLEARAFKDVMPRFKTMQGFFVRRKGGWDTHGLPVEIQVEKELGLKSKKEVEAFGIEKFNEKCKESVWKYVHEWEDFTKRAAYWVDLKHAYITYKPYYIESLWNIVKNVDDQGLLYKDYKVVPWCPRCGTALSSHELAQGYETVKDLSVTVKFRVSKGGSFSDLRPSQRGQVLRELDERRTSSSEEGEGPKGKNLYFLAWTTTPWTLPGNVALAVGENIDYVEVRLSEENDHLILAKDRLNILKDAKYEIIRQFKGKDLVGTEYEPLYDFMPKNDKTYKVYGADFVTTEDGTGIVHIAPMYGQDDFELGSKNNLPKHHVVNEDGTFKAETGFLAGKFVKDEEVAVEIIKDLAGKNKLFGKEKYEHSYPTCWRCHTPLIYYARDSWYIQMSKLQKKMVKENEKIHWQPEHIKEGRFGEWLREVKDWAISRERYWGTPLPVWSCGTCGEKKVIGSIAELLEASTQKANNHFWVMRHGEAENNTKRVYDCGLDSKYGLTESGKNQVLDTIKTLKKQKIDLVFASPILRTKETAELIKKELGLGDNQVIFDERLKECQYGIYNGRSDDELSKNSDKYDRYIWRPEGGENYSDIKKRMGDFVYDVDDRFKGKNILVVTHETPAMLLCAAAMGLDVEQSKEVRTSGDFLENAAVKAVDLKKLPHNDNYELDLHRPYIDEVKLFCKCGGEINRIKEVMDVWFDSGAMPFAQDHYPFENKKYVDKEGYPADFISEAIDQTRGWFYTLHAVGALLGKGKAYKNVICLGHLLDAKGKKMSKHIGNVVNPWEMMDKYGADALRFWMYSVNQAGDAKNFEEKTVDEVVKKVFNLLLNVTTFYELYADTVIPASPERMRGAKLAPDSDRGAGIRNQSDGNALDAWIISRLNQLIATVTAGLEDYDFFGPTRAIRDFIADLSQWYVRRSRDRFKGENSEEDKNTALETTRFVLGNLAKLMAPFTPFMAEEIYKRTGGSQESVHLEDWPKAGKVDSQLIESMQIVRDVASKGLEARMQAKINVRQPLSKLKIKNQKSKISKNLQDLIKDEVNVKEVLFFNQLENDVELDTNITDELKEEGMFRELVRAVQDLRKEKGLTIKDMAVLRVETDEAGQQFLKKAMENIKKATLLDEVIIGNASGDKIKLGDMEMKIEIAKK